MLNESLFWLDLYCLFQTPELHIFLKRVVSSEMVRETAKFWWPSTHMESVSVWYSEEQPWGGGGGLRCIHFKSNQWAIIRDCIPARVSNFSVRCCCQHESWQHPSSCPDVSFMGIKRQERKTHHSPPLVVWVHGAVPPHAHEFWGRYLIEALSVHKDHQSSLVLFWIKMCPEDWVSDWEVLWVGSRLWTKRKVGVVFVWF